MDIHETIKTLSKLINENAENINEPLYEIDDYIYMNISVLNKNIELKQEIANCFLLLEQRLVKFPDKA